jgi:hypothetical protein
MDDPLCVTRTLNEVVVVEAEVTALKNSKIELPLFKLSSSSRPLDEAVTDSYHFF